jgi:hypothetical protein
MCISIKNFDTKLVVSSIRLWKNEMGATLVLNWYQLIWYQVDLVYNTNDDTNIDTKVRPIYT